MNIPAELKYTKDHEWIKIDGDVATVGITDFAQGELGDIVYVEIETEGEELDQEEVDLAARCIKMICGELLFRKAERIIMENEL